MPCSRGALRRDGSRDDEPDHQDDILDLARQWTKLATDIEMAVALRAELEPGPKFDGVGASRSSW
jgi:hypothetical protein